MTKIQIPGYRKDAVRVERQDVRVRLCALLDRVWCHFDPYAHSPNDCLCGEHRPKENFQTTDAALFWLEALVGVVLTALEKNVFVLDAEDAKKIVPVPKDHPGRIRYPEAKRPAMPPRPRLSENEVEGLLLDAASGDLPREVSNRIARLVVEVRERRDADTD